MIINMRVCVKAGWGDGKQNKWVSTGFDPILKGDLCRQRAGVCVGVLHSDVIPVPISVSP